MSVDRLSPLDAAFLALERPTAHMHVGWAAVFDPPQGRPRPGFAELFDHTAGRLAFAPRLRQRLARVPLAVHDPEWVDDPRFDPAAHIRRAELSDLGELVAAVMSQPLPRERPLWELWIADRLADGRIAVVGKAHHCMVDGIAAVRLGMVLLDPGPEPPAVLPREWRAPPAPGAVELVARGLRDRVAEGRALAALPARVARSPARLAALPGGLARVWCALAHAALPPAPASPLNRPGSPRRQLAMLARPLADLRWIGGWGGATVNDVLLAACAGALRRRAARGGEPPVDLKAMVPVNVRDPAADRGLGNRISFAFIRLPCREPDPVLRLLAVQRQTARRKRAGEPADLDAALRALGHAPPPLRRAVAHLSASPRLFNLVVSNIPGPAAPMYLRGCLLREAYPVVPLADRHALSIGMTRIGELACLGVYADARTLPDATALADDLDAALDELLALSAPRTPPNRPAPPPPRARAAAEVALT